MSTYDEFGLEAGQSTSRQPTVRRCEYPAVTSQPLVPALFIHGLIGAFSDERALAPLRRRRLLRPDLLGYGDEAVGGDATEISVDAQVAHLLTIATDALGESALHVVGHSVGAVIGAAFVHRLPGRIASFVNVEGNFSMADAFWSAQLAAKPLEDVEAMLQADRCDPSGWLRRAGAYPTPDRVELATQALSFQPAATIHAMARAVVEYTDHPRYTALLEEVFARVPVHLVAGARSRSGWHVPTWALRSAASYSEIPNAGHMVMLEQPESFGRTLSSLLDPTSGTRVGD